MPHVTDPTLKDLHLEADRLGLPIAENTDIIRLALEKGIHLDESLSEAAARHPRMVSSGLRRIAESSPGDVVRIVKKAREARVEGGLTQAEVGRQCGLHRPDITKIETRPLECPCTLVFRYLSTLDFLLTQTTSPWGN